MLLGVCAKRRLQLRHCITELVTDAITRDLGQLGQQCCFCFTPLLLEIHDDFAPELLWQLLLGFGAGAGHQQQLGHDFGLAPLAPRPYALNLVVRVKHENTGENRMAVVKGKGGLFVGWV